METEQLLIDFVLPKPQKNSIGFIQDIILVFSFSFLTALCARIKIEIGAVPVTFQTFAVLLSGFLLGSIRGGLSQVLYLFWGLIGLPLFARGGGIQYLLSPTFGYIIGFVFAAFLVGKLAEKGWDRNFMTSIFAMIVSNALIYIFGLAWLAKFIPFENILKVGLYPFLVGDMIKILLVGLIFPSSWRLIRKFKGQRLNNL